MAVTRISEGVGVTSMGSPRSAAARWRTWRTATSVARRLGCAGLGAAAVGGEGLAVAEAGSGREREAGRGGWAGAGGADGRRRKAVARRANPANPAAAKRQTGQGRDGLLL